MSEPKTRIPVPVSWIAKVSKGENNASLNEGNKGIYLMTMCVENVPISVCKKNAYQKEQPFQYAFLI